ncbi:MAG: TonB-dependent receptor, partial [Kofleriaceae bacterium]|nr:TonB-dependent receptor [Kofleriaceae bacterium]
GGQFAVTDGDGNYKITELVPGTYDVDISFETTHIVRAGVIVGASNVTPIFQAMKIGESIRIIGSPPPINIISTAKEKRIDRDQITKLPTPGDTIESVLGTVPGSQNDGAGVAFSGASGLENRYLVDGNDITGLTFGNIGSPILNEFVHEVVAVTGGYNAEYGRATGGIVNIITRSGTDTLSGSVFGIYQPGWLSAAAHATPSNSSSIDITGNNAYDGHLGFEIGGPIVKKHAWFYLGVAPKISRTDYTRTTKRQTDCRKVLDNGSLSTCEAANADGQPDLDPTTGFYLTDTLDKETRSATARTTNIIAKINAAPNARDKAMLSLIAMPSSSKTPALAGLPTTGTRSWGLTTDLAARWTSKFDEGRTEVEASLAWHRSTFNTGAQDSSYDNTALQVLAGGDLAHIAAFGGESAKTIEGCTDLGAGDPYPLISNCPMDNSTYTIGGPGSISRDREERRAARIGIIRRLDALGTHEIKVGLDVEDAQKVSTRMYSGGGLIQNYGSTIYVNRWAEIAPPGSTDPAFDRTCSTADPADPNGGDKMLRCRYLGGLDDPATKIDGQTVNWGAYLQDSWQPLRNLTLNAGVRYEEQRLRYAQRLRGTQDALTGNYLGDNAMVLRGNFSPRIGAIYDPTNQGRSKVYAAWGRYFEGIPMDINDRSFGGEVSLRQTYDANTCGPIDPATGFADGNACLSTTRSPASQELLGSSGVLVAPGIQAQYMDEGLIGAEVALPSNFVFGAVLQHRRLGRVIEDVSPDGANTYIIANPGEWSAEEERKLEQQIATTTDKAVRARLERDLSLYRGIRQFDKPVRDYVAVELSVSRRFTSGLYLSGSYTYSRTDGNYPGLVSYDNGQIDPNISSQYDLIELLGNRRGRLPQDRPHYIKIDAYRGFDIGDDSVLTIGTRIRALSGIPRNALAAHYLYGGDESYLLPRGQLGRTDFEHGIDLQVSYKRKLTKTTAAELYVDIFNLYNRQGTFRVDDTYAPQFSLSSGGVGGLEQNANPISGGTYEDLIWSKRIDADGNESAQPLGRNPNFGNTTARYAPASAQVGFRVTF